MTITDTDAAQEASLLDEAERGRQQIRQTTSVYPGLSIDDAYRIQAAWRHLKTQRGERIVGHKIGLTSRAMQAAMKISTPDSGFLTDRMVFEPNSVLHAGDFSDPKVEVELAFRLSDDVGGTDLSIEDILDATEHVYAAVELIAARSYRRAPETDRPRTVIDTIADNAANAGIICGSQPMSPRARDLRWVGAIVRRNDMIEETGLAAAVLDHPAAGIAWLARRYAEQGLHLKAGEIVLSGAFTRPVDVRAGDDFLFDFGELGEFGLEFV